MESSEKICVKWNNFGQQVRSLFGQLRKDGEFVDVTLACEDGQQMAAHQILLASQSPTFMNILKGNQRPNTHPIIYMRGVNSENLVAIVDFLYCGEMNIEQENLTGCLALAEDLQLAGFSGEFSKRAVGDYSRAGEKQAGGCNPSEENAHRQGVIKKSVSHPLPSSANGDCFTQSPGSSENLVLEEAIRAQTELQNSPKVVSDFKVEAKDEEDLDETLDFTTYENQMLQLDKKIKTMIQFSKNFIPTTLGEKKERKRICKVCGKEDRYNGIKRHIESKHFTGFLHPCEICGKTFGTRYKLARHMLGQHRK